MPTMKISLLEIARERQAEPPKRREQDANFVNIFQIESTHFVYSVPSYALHNIYSQMNNVPVSRRRIPFPFSHRRRGEEDQYHSRSSYYSHHYSHAPPPPLDRHPPRRRRNLHNPGVSSYGCRPPLRPRPPRAFSGLETEHE